MSIRSTAKAIVVRGRCILLIKCFDSRNGSYYCLPGGGQQTYETLYDALVRECLEETGYTVVPVRFAALCEEICDDPEIRRNYPDYAHKMLHIFICKLGDKPQIPPKETDQFQTGVEWAGIDALDSVKLLPAVVGAHISALIDGDGPLFLGSAHITYNHG